MGEEMKWLIGLASAIGLSIAGYVIAALRALSQQIKTGDDGLHERVNRFRDEYVRRDDMQDYMKRFDDTLRDMRTENRQLHDQTNSRLDKVLHTK